MNLNVCKIQRLITAAFLLLYTCNAAAQNSQPAFSNVTVIADTIGHFVKIDYSVYDKDDDSLKITCSIVDRSGKRLNVVPADFSGDIGYPVRRGNRKSVIWKYPALTKHIGQYTFSLIADDLYNISMYDLIKQVDTGNLRKNLRAIYGIRDMHSKQGRKHLREVREMIKKKFAAGGLTVHTQEMKAGTKKGYNILGDYRGLQNDSVTYILCAHFDGAPGSPAADDNGSGVAGMLEVLHVLSKVNFKHNLRFIAFDMEENGCIGSRTYIDVAIKHGDKIAGVINFDMIGFYSKTPGSQIIPEGFESLFPEACKKISKNASKGDFGVTITNDSSKSLSAMFERNAFNYVPSLKSITLTTPDNGNSTPTMSSGDHGSFWRAGYKAIFIGDGGETRDVFLDTPKDVIKNINYQFMADNVKATIATLAECAVSQHAGKASLKIIVK